MYVKRAENQVAVVTGGSRGIGEGIVRRFIQEGARVVFSDLLTGKAKALEEELGERTPDIVEPWLAEILPLGRSGFPADIANAALWLASGESNFVTGEVLTGDGGLTAGRRGSQTLQRYDQLRERFRSALGQTTVTSQRRLEYAHMRW